METENTEHAPLTRFPKILASVSHSYILKTYFIPDFTMDSRNTKTAAPAAGHGKEAVAQIGKTTSGSQTQDVDKENTAFEAYSCPAQANTALTTDGFKEAVLADEETKQQHGNDDSTAAAATTTTSTGAKGVEPVEGIDHQQKHKQKKQSDDGAKVSS